MVAGGNAASVPPAPGGGPQYPNGTCARGLSCPSFCHCAQDTASLWQFGILPSHSPLFYHSQSQAKPQRHCWILPYLPKNTSYGGPNSFLVAPDNLPSESILFFLHRSLVLEFSHWMVSLAVGGSATYRDAPREQTFHTSIS